MKFQDARVILGYLMGLILAAEARGIWAKSPMNTMGDSDIDAWPLRLYGREVRNDALVLTSLMAHNMTSLVEPLQPYVSVRLTGSIDLLFIASVRDLAHIA
jgi:hypothetical protein